MSGPPPDHRWAVAIIGAGAGGLALAIRLRQQGIEDFVLLEASDGVGGTWRANTYPGAACDVPSHLYSYSFAPHPGWSRTFAPQPEILRYFEACADRFGVRPHLRTGTAVHRATWHPERGCWVLDTDGQPVEASVVVSALGMLHVPAYPAVDGLREGDAPVFGGTVMHSARWDHGHDLGGQRVAVVGSGASAIQIVPAIAPAAAHVTVLQRSPAWIMPRIDRAYSPEEQSAFAADPALMRAHRREIYAAFERNTLVRAGDPRAAEFTGWALGHLHHRIHDPAMRAALTPRYPLGAKRVLVSSDYYPALRRDDVELAGALAGVTPAGVVDVDGREHPVDTIVLATGFAATRYLAGLEVVGAGGRSLHGDEWCRVPHAHLGMTVSGFPNFFMMYGPNTNQGGNSILVILEAQAEYVLRALGWMRAHDAAAVDVRRDVMERYNAELQAELATSVWASGGDSYFKDGEGHIVTQLPHPSRWYRRRTRHFQGSEYEVTIRGGPVVHR